MFSFKILYTDVINVLSSIHKLLLVTVLNVKLHYSGKHYMFFVEVDKLCDLRLEKFIIQSEIIDFTRLKKITLKSIKYKFQRL